MPVLKNLLIAADQAFNCLFRLDGGWGQPDETLSARAWRVRETHPAWARWIDRLFFWQRVDGKSHCQQAYDNEVIRAHLPTPYQRPESETWTS
jgi:chloramphenicol 3-O-phosphotransferase